LVVGSEDAELWREELGTVGRREYKNLRKKAYAELDHFFDDVAARLVRPTWEAPAKTKVESGDPQQSGES
jgi:hypothetical protein